MTPEEKEAVRLQLTDYIVGTTNEWLRLADLEPSPDQAGQYRISWENPTDGAMIASISKTRYGEPVVRIGVQIMADVLPDLPPIGPENDLGVYGIDDGPAPEWLPATFVQCLAGDRIRLGSEETVVRWTSALQWHADTSDRYQPKSWDHVELRMDLEAAPGRRPYPPDHACEILCDLERAAILGIQSQFPGTQTS